MVVVMVMMMVKAMMMVMAMVMMMVMVMMVMMMVMMMVITRAGYLALVMGLPSAGHGQSVGATRQQQQTYLVKVDGRVQKHVRHENHFT